MGTSLPVGVSREEMSAERSLARHPVPKGLVSRDLRFENAIPETAVRRGCEPESRLSGRGNVRNILRDSGF